MKFNVKSKSFLGHLASVGRVIPPKPALAILSNFHLALKDGSLTVTASDTDTVVSSKLQTEEASGNGEICLNAKRLTDILKAMPDCLLSFDVNTANGDTIIKYPNGKYNMVGQSSDNYPLYDRGEEPEGIASFDMAAADILSAFDKVAFAASTDEFRTTMQGVYWDVIEGDSITFVATDTRMLAKYRSTAIKPNRSCSFLVHNSVLGLVRAMIAKEAMVTVRLTPKSVIFYSKTFHLRTALAGGKFPDYNRVIPTNSDKKVHIDRQALLNAVNRASVCSDNETNLMRMGFDNDKVEVAAQNINYGMSGSETVPCAVDGGSLVIGFNSVYLKSLLGAISTPSVVIELTNNTRPAVFLPSEKDDKGELTLLIMPLTIN